MALSFGLRNAFEAHNKGEVTRQEIIEKLRQMD